MIKIKNIDLSEDTPEYVVNCAGCGGYGNDLKIVEFFMAVKKGNHVRKAGHATQLNLCRDCRREAAHFLAKSCID